MFPFTIYFIPSTIPIPNAKIKCTVETLELKLLHFVTYTHREREHYHSVNSTHIGYFYSVSIFNYHQSFIVMCAFVYILIGTRTCHYFISSQLSIFVVCIFNLLSLCDFHSLSHGFLCSISLSLSPSIFISLSFSVLFHETTNSTRNHSF